MEDPKFLVVSQVQLVSGAGRAVADLSAAKNSRSREEARRAAQAKKKEELQARKAAKNKRVAEQAAEEAKRAKQAKLPHRLDALPADILQGISLIRDLQKLEVEDGAQPFMVSLSAADLASAGIRKIVEEENFLATTEAFKKAFKTTSAAKGTGRAQCSLKPVETSAVVLQCFQKSLVPFRLKGSAIGLPALGNVSMFGCCGGMHFISSEYEGLGQLRWMVHGIKKTYAAPAAKIRDAMEVLGLQCDSEESMYRFFRQLTETQIKESKLEVISFTIHAGEGYYLPSGWVMGDFCPANEDAVGLRLTSLSEKDTKEGNANFLLKLQEKKATGQHIENLRKVLQSVSA